MTCRVPLEIVPRVGVGPVRLGMTRDQVDAALTALPGGSPGSPRGTAPIMCYFSNSVQIEFDSDGTACFIEVAGFHGTLCTFRGHDVFDLAAAELFSLFASADSAGPHDFSAAEYLFPDLIVAVWGADEQYDRAGRGGRKVYATVGVGDERYLAAIRGVDHGDRKVSP